ncbi:MAG: hypothetical protein LBH22_00865 [Bacteroidales bacterium]|jgi:hypothetical protein|nr:hypothetical protein [Bacteroidales bacterium]
MRGILFLIAAICIYISCEKTKGGESLRITIENKTDSIIHVKLEPKKLEGYNLYAPIDWQGGPYYLTEFDLLPGSNQMLFRTSDINVEPYELASRAFYNISIYSVDRKTLFIKFSQNNIALGYSEDIFTNNSTWNYELEHSCPKPPRTCKNPGKIHSYTFSILEDKIIIE